MNLKERINEALQSLVEAAIKPSDLRGDNWNKVYNDSKYEMKASAGKKLYRIKLYQNEGGPEATTARFLTVRTGLDTKNSYFTKKWLKKNLDSAEVSFSDVEAGGSVFELGPDEVKALQKNLSSWKAKRKLSYDRVSMVELPEQEAKEKEPAGETDAIEEDSVDVTNEQVIQLFMSEVLKAVKSKKPGERFWGDFAASSMTPTKDAIDFYNKYLNSKEKIETTLEQTKEPLWGNPILLISLYLYGHGYAGDDLVVKAATIANKLADSDKALHAEGFAMKLAINPTLLAYESSQEYGSVVQLAEHIVYNNGGYNNKNERVRSASEDIKEDIVKYIVIKPAGQYEAAYEEVGKYVLDKGAEHLKGGTLQDVDITSAPVNSYDIVKTNAKLVLLSSIGSGSSLNITADVNGNNIGWFWLTWDDENLYVDDRDKFLYKLISSIKESTNKKANIAISKDRKSKDFVNINEVDIPDSEKIVKFLSDNKLVEIDFSNIPEKVMKDFTITYNEGNGKLSFSGAGASIAPSESVDPKEAEKNDAAEEIPPEAIDTATELKNLGLLDEIEPDGTDDGEMIRGCTVSRGDIITGHDGNHYIVMKKNIGNGKWDIKSGTKILRWKKHVVDKIGEMGFSLNPGNWGKTGVTRESLMTDLGYIRNDLND